MSLPKIFKNIDARVKKAGDTMSGDLNLQKVQNGKSKIYKNHSNSADYGLSLLDETSNGNNALGTLNDSLNKFRMKSFCSLSLCKIV
jgi:hypothetical protein